jgi:uncharacterized membrane protein SirB2
MFTLLKTIHVSAVALSFTGFLLRGLWMRRGSPLLAARWVKTVPHVVDTVLLGSGIALALRLHQYPFVNGWLSAKLIGLLAYIGLGMVALRFGRTRGTRTLAWLAAMAVFAYIVAVAVTRNPLVFY